MKSKPDKDPKLCLSLNERAVDSAPVSCSSYRFSRFLSVSLAFHVIALAVILNLPKESLRFIPGRDKTIFISLISEGTRPGKHTNAGKTMKSKKHKSASQVADSAKDLQPQPGTKPDAKSHSELNSKSEPESNSESNTLENFGDWGSIGDAASLGYVRDNYVQPEYPRKSRLRKEEGRVLIGVRTNNGKISEVKIIRGSGFPLLDHAAVRAIEQWEFESGLTVAFVQPVTFKIE